MPITQRQRNKMSKRILDVINSGLYEDSVGDGLQAEWKRICGIRGIKTGDERRKEEETFHNKLLDYENTIAYRSARMK